MTADPKRVRRPAAMAAALIALLYVSTAAAINLRGKVEEVRSVSTNPYPANAKRVELRDASAQRVLGQAYTGADGMYYLQNVGAGRYVLRVDGRDYPFAVAVNPPNQNVAPIRLGGRP